MFNEFILMLLENAEQTITLNELIANLDNEPEQYIMDMFNSNDYDIPLTIKYRDPSDLLVSDKPIKEWVNDLNKRAKNYVSDWQKRIRFGEIPPIILSDNRILDGCHRAMAHYLAGENVPYVDIHDLP